MQPTQSPTDRRTGPVSAGVSEGGLTIERRFTQAGVDPFDTVDWQLRTAEVGIGEPVSQLVHSLEIASAVLVLDGGHPVAVLSRSDVLAFLGARTGS